MEDQHQHQQPNEEMPNQQEMAEQEEHVTNHVEKDLDVESATLITAECTHAIVDKAAEDERAEKGEDNEEIENGPDSKPNPRSDEAKACDTHFSTMDNEGLATENTNSSSSESFANAKRSSVVPLVNLSSSITGGAAAAAANIIEPSDMISPSSPNNRRSDIRTSTKAVANRNRKSIENKQKAPIINSLSDAASNSNSENSQSVGADGKEKFAAPKSSGLSLATPYGEVTSLGNTACKSLTPPGAQYLASPATARNPSASTGGSLTNKSLSSPRGAVYVASATSLRAAVPPHLTPNPRFTPPSGAYAVRQSSGGQLVISGRGGAMGSIVSTVSAETTNQNILSGDGSAVGNDSHQSEITANIPIQAELAEDSQDIEKIVEERVEERIRERDGAIAVAEVADTRSSSIFKRGESHLLLQIKRGQAYKLLGCILIVVAVIVAVLVVVFVPKEVDANEETIENDQQTKETVQPTEILSLSTIEQVQSRGMLRCGTSEFSIGFALRDSETGNVDGFLIEICRALAKIVLNDPEKYEVVVVNDKTRFTFLRDHEIDVLSWTTTFTMGRDVFESDTEFGMTFSAPYYYTGAAFAGEPTFVECAENLDSFNGPCRELAICVRESTTHDLVLDEIFRGPEKVFAQNIQGAVEFLKSGKCNVMIGDSVEMPEAAVRLLGYTGTYKLGTSLFSKEPLSIATRDGDPEWSNMANMVIESLVTAEALNITQDTAENDFAMIKSMVGDEELASFFVDVISTVGNMAEVFERHLEDQFPREAMNLLNKGDNGLIYSLPLGDVEKKGELVRDGVLASILERKKLRCGVSRRGPGFAEFNESSLLGWSGMDIEYCLAVSAALFSSRNARDRIEFVEIDTKDTLAALARGDVDLLAGERMTLQSLWQDPVTETGFSFSPSYFYGENEDSFALATLQDSDFADFVFWVVQITFYAEENSITHESSTELPIVSLFGESLKQMFLDSIWEVGSYGEIYNRTVQSIYPRTGRNLLNMGTTPQMIGFPLM